MFLQTLSVIQLANIIKQAAIDESENISVWDAVRSNTFTPEVGFWTQHGAAAEFNLTKKPVAALACEEVIQVCVLLISFLSPLLTAFESTHPPAAADSIHMLSFSLSCTPYHSIHLLSQANE